MSYPYKPVEKWDVHTHTTLSPDSFTALARFSDYADFVRVRAHKVKPCCAEMVNGRGEVLRIIEDNAYDGKARIRECDRSGVTMQILSPTPMMIPDYVDNPEDAAAICAILNDDNARLVTQFPDRFMALGALPMAHPAYAIREMERIRKEHDMRGVEINSNVNGSDLDDPAFFPVFAAAAEMGMAIFIHPWGGFMSPSEESLKKRMNANRNWRPWLIGMPMETALAFDSLCRGGVHEKLPHLRVMYAHGAGVVPAILGRMEHGSYCRPDLFAGTSPMDPYETLRSCSIYADSLVHSPFAFAALLGTLGASRIAMGSDYPYPLGEMEFPDTDGIYPGHMIEHLPGLDTDMKEAWAHFDWINPHRQDGSCAELPRLDDAQRQRILSGTAREWLGV